MSARPAVYPLVRAVGVFWTKTCEHSEAVDDFKTYYVNQLLAHCVFGCFKHAVSCHGCNECDIMTRTDAHLREVGGISAVVIAFQIIRRPLQDSWVIERIDKKIMLIDSTQDEGSARKRALLLKSLPQGLESLFCFQVYRYITVERDSGKVPAFPDLFEPSMSMQEYALQELQRMSEHSLRPGIGNSMKLPLFCNNDVLPSYTPPLRSYKVAEGGMASMTCSRLSVTLTNMVHIDFSCQFASQRTTLYLHTARSAVHSPCPVISVCFQLLDPRLPLRVGLHSTSVEPPAALALCAYSLKQFFCGVTFRLFRVLMPSPNTPLHSSGGKLMSSHKIDKLHLPRVMYNVPIDNGLQAWPVFLHWYISPEDSHQKSRAQKIVMRTACENAELTWWLQEGVPAKHIYALLSVLRPSVLQACLKNIRQLSVGIPLHSVRQSLSLTLQDYIFSWFLQYKPALNTLQDCAVDLMMRIARACCRTNPNAPCAAVSASLRCFSGHFQQLQRVVPITGMLTCLCDFSDETMACLLMEVLCDVTIDVFTGGPLVNEPTELLGTPLQYPPRAMGNTGFDIRNMSVYQIRDELVARGFSIDPVQSRDSDVLRAMLCGDMVRNRFSNDISLWEGLGDMRRAVLMPVPGLTCAARDALRAFIVTSKAHRTASALLMLKGRSHAARTVYSQRAMDFITVLQTCFDVTENA